MGIPLGWTCCQVRQTTISPFHGTAANILKCSHGQVFYSGADEYNDDKDPKNCDHCQHLKCKHCVVVFGAPFTKLADAITKRDKDGDGGDGKGKEPVKTKKTIVRSRMSGKK